MLNRDCNLNFKILGLLYITDPPNYNDSCTFSKESHRGTLLGMTRFRDVMDDMPILGYGRGDVHHDRQGGLGS